MLAVACDVVDFQWVWAVDLWSIFAVAVILKEEEGKREGR